MRSLNRFSACLLIASLYLLLPSYLFGANTAINPAYKVESLPFEKGEKDKYNLDITQPYSFNLQTIKESMASLAWQKKGLVWSDKKRVFNSSAIEVLSPLIVEQYAKSDKDHRVTFQLKNRSGKVFIKGDTFLTPEGMHWRFVTMNTSKRNIDEFSVTGEFWRLIPRKEQDYMKKQPFKKLTQDITNWVIAKNIRPDASRIINVVPESGLPKDNKKDSFPEAEIKNKLRLLEELKKEGLIKEEEYKIKRQEILKSF